LEELGIERQVGHPTEIRAAEPRKQKDDRSEALAWRNCNLVSRGKKKP
jgi:hypothetical protein